MIAIYCNFILFLHFFPPSNPKPPAPPPTRRQVCHHPTIVAAAAEGRAWRFEGDACIRSRFWGRSIELRPEGVLKLTFADGDAYAWSKVATSINNLILGKIYVDHGGVMRVRCLAPAARGLAARLRFKEAGGLFDRDPRQVRGL